MNGPRLVLLALAHALPGAAFAPPPDTLTVVVFDATPCRPVPGATVTVGAASRRTGVDGAARFGSPETTPWAVRVSVGSCRVDVGGDARPPRVVTVDAAGCRRIGL